MGSRNLDRIHISEWRDKVRTAADMWAKGWKVHAVCEVCERETVVDLDHLVRLAGPGVSLWDKTSRCKQVLNGAHRCDGRVFFKALAPGASGYAFLGSPPRPRRPAYGPQARGKGPFVRPEDIEPPEATAARGPTPPAEE